MFIWLSSYPKSGNTLVRSMLSAYYFSNNGKYDFEQIKNIKQFPKTSLFEKIGVDITDEKEIIKNYINVQKKLIKKNSIQFLKTHSYLFNIDNNQFTDLKHSLGVIYIVRDPRNVVTSWANHSNYSIEEATDGLINANKIPGDLYDPKKKIKSYVYVGNWSENYNSWKSFTYQDRYLLIKYEDLIKDKKGNFKKILHFIKYITKTNLEIDEAKIEKTINEIDFEKLKKLEKRNGFPEAKKDDQGRKIIFFRKGESNQWKEILDKKIQKLIETSCEKEMEELGYL